MIIKDSEMGKTLDYVNDLFLDRFKQFIDIVPPVVSEEVERESYCNLFNCFSAKDKRNDSEMKARISLF